MFYKFECYDDLKRSNSWTIKLSRPNSQHEKLKNSNEKQHTHKNWMIWNGMEWCGIPECWMPIRSFFLCLLFFFFAFCSEMCWMLNEGWNFSSLLRKNQLSNVIHMYAYVAELKPFNSLSVSRVDYIFFSSCHCKVELYTFYIFVSSELFEFRFRLQLAQTF